MLRRRYHSIECLLVSTAIALFALGSSAWATQVRPLNLEQMTERAATIFAGRCVRIETRQDEGVGRKVTLATFEVDRAVKGQVGDTVTVKILGSADAGVRGEDIVGMPKFQQGEEVVLFLYGESELGLSSPVGFGQGKFSVFEDKLGRRISVNEFGNKNLLNGLSDGARTRLGATLAQWKDKPELDRTALLDMVEQLKH